jgi:hypothetical protein
MIQHKPEMIKTNKSYLVLFSMPIVPLSKQVVEFEENWQLFKELFQLRL